MTLPKSSVCLVLIFVTLTLGVRVRKLDVTGDKPPQVARGACIDLEYGGSNSDLHVFALGLGEDWDLSEVRHSSSICIYNHTALHRDCYNFTGNGVSSPEARGFNPGFYTADGFGTGFGATLSFCAFSQTCQGPMTAYSDIWHFHIPTMSWEKRPISGDIPGVFTINNTTYWQGSFGVDSVQTSANDVYFFGGLSPTPPGVESPFGPYLLSNDIYHYNIRTARFTKINVVGPKPAARMYSTMFRLGAHDVGLTGGEILIQDATDPIIWKFDVSSRRWFQVGMQQEPTVQLMYAVNTHRYGPYNQVEWFGGDTSLPENPCGYHRPAYPSKYFQKFHLNSGRTIRAEQTNLGNPDNFLHPTKRACAYLTKDNKHLHDSGWYLTPEDPTGDCSKWNGDIYEIENIHP